MSEVLNRVGKELGDGLSQDLSEFLRDIVEGGSHDIRYVAQAISRDMISAVREPDPEKRAQLLLELKGQGKLLMEKHRIKLTKDGEVAFNRGIDLAFSVATRVLFAAL